MQSRFDYCFIGLKCYGLLAGQSVPKYLGGIEKVFVALAKSLSDAGKKVAFITYDEGFEDGEIQDGVAIFKAHNPEQGLPIVRLIYPRMTAIWGAMRRARAHYYLQMGAGVETFAVALGVKMLVPQAAFVYCVASNLDCEQYLSGIATFHERILYKCAIAMADQVVAQTKIQAEMLKQHFGRTSQVIPMPFEAKDDPLVRLHCRSDAMNLLWVGRWVDVKRLEWMLDIAELLPDMYVHIVGTANQASDYDQQLMARAKRNLPNVIIHGRISNEQLTQVFQHASILCCTSSKEGFPTTFLEAWKIGLPIVTSFDPDGLVATHQVGVVGLSKQDLINGIRRLEQDADFYQRCKKNAISFYQECFSPIAIREKYIHLFP